MYPTSVVAACAVISATQGVIAWPGMKTTYNELLSRAEISVNDKINGKDGFKVRINDKLDSYELIGDLATLPDNKLSPVGRDIKQIITGGGNPESHKSYPGGVAPAPLGSMACARDTCCKWKHIADTFQETFRGSSGRCTDFARAAVRLGFHDAAGWSKSTGTKGGADGSIALSTEESQRPANRGLEEIIDLMNDWHAQFAKYDVSMADLIQWAANVATVVCPLGPRVKSYVGRIDSNVAAPDGLLPRVDQSADELIRIFEDKTIRPHGLTALIGAHTTSQQRFVDPSRAGDPQDSTPGVWDTNFYRQTLGPAPPRVFRFASDIALAQHPSVASEFQAFAASNGQSIWNEDYAREYIRLSLLGVYNINNLTECTKALPAATTKFDSPDQDLLSTWVNSTMIDTTVQTALREGSLLSPVSSLIGKLTTSA